MPRAGASRSASADLAGPAVGYPRDERETSHGIGVAQGGVTTPTIQDVVGRPLPGTGLAPRPTPLGAVAFRRLMEQALHRTAAARPAVDPPVGRRTAGAARTAPATPWTQLGVRGPWPASARKPATHAAGARRTPAGTTATRRTGHAVDRSALRGAIHRAATHAGVEPALSVAIARAESSLDPSAVSPDGISVGTFQVTHATKAEMRRKFAAGIVDRPPGTDDVALGVGYLDYLDRVFRKDTGLTARLSTDGIADQQERRRFVAAAFNAGEGRVAGAQVRARQMGLDPTRFANIRRFLPAITQGYVDRVQRYAGEESATLDRVG
jgi:soluble lytic murein transglycosylase-like protein